MSDDLGFKSSYTKINFLQFSPFILAIIHIIIVLWRYEIQAIPSFTVNIIICN